MSHFKRFNILLLILLGVLIVDIVNCEAQTRRKRRTFGIAYIPEVRSEVVVIVHKNNPIVKMSYQELRDIYLGKKVSWDQGSRIKLLTRRKSTNEFNIFLKKILQIDGSDFSNAWLKNLFSDDHNRPPITMDSNNDVINTVSRDRDAIGFAFNREVKVNIRIVKTLRLVK